MNPKTVVVALDPRMKAARKLWRPKFPEMKEPCASCPFLVGNREQFRSVMGKLAEHDGLPEPTGKDEHRARAQIMLEVERFGGEFQCHQSVYDENMNLRPQSERRQCAGAARFYRGET